MAFSRKPKSKDDFLAEADAVPPETSTGAIPVTAGLGSTGFDSKGIERVLTGTVIATTKQPEARPWDGLDPEGRADQILSIRLNRYEMAILRHLANENEDLSMQKIVRRALVPEFYRKAGIKV